MLPPAVPEKRWFVWPQFAIREYGNVAISGRAESLVSWGMLSPSQILGPPMSLVALAASILNHEPVC